MARPQKKGLDYFPVVTEWDTKMRLVKARFGLLGVGVVVSLFQAIYREGYALSWDEDEELLFASESNIGLDELRPVVAFAVDHGLFSKAMLEAKKVLTSHGIQKQWQTITGKFKRNNIEIDPEISLLAPDETPPEKPPLGFPPEETPENEGFPPEETPQSGGLTMEETRQRKGKERKGKEKKGPRACANAESGDFEAGKPEGDEAVPFDYALRLAFERHAGNPQAMAKKLVREPDVIAAYRAQDGPKKQNWTSCPPPVPNDEDEQRELDEKFRTFRLPGLVISN